MGTYGTIAVSLGQAFCFLTTIMSTPCQLSHPYPASSPPSERAKMAPPSPPTPLRQKEAAPTIDPDDKLSVFDSQNIFQSRWFLNRDDLIANVLSTQKNDNGCFTW